MRTSILLMLLVISKVTFSESVISEVVKQINNLLVKGEAAAKTNDFAEQLTKLVTIGVRHVPLPGNSLVGSTNTKQFLIDYKFGSKNEDARLTGTELASKYGYYVADHYVTTKDGYILKCLRIQKSNKDANGTEKCLFNRKPVVFLMHGLICSADEFIYQGLNRSLAYILADTGYDVWLGNARGNRYSRNHTHLDPNEAKFWEFSFDEMGCEDLPSMIDYILDVTGEDKLGYIGHSQGTTAFFVMASMRPEYNDKVAIMIALSAVSYMEHADSPVIRILSLVVDQLELTAKLIGANEFVPHNDFLNSLSSQLYGDTLAYKIVASNVIFLICGFNLEEIDTKILTLALGHIPAGSSARAFVHYVQEVGSKEFCRYSYGSKGNLQKYGSKKPPSYPIANITAPVLIYYSENDWLANEKDVTRFSDQLCNLIELRKIAKYNHFNYLIGKTTKEKIYDGIVESMKDYVK